VRKLIRNGCVAALLGATSGLANRHLKHHPQRVKEILISSSIPGIAGLVLGSCYGYFSRKVMVFTGLKGAGTFYLISCSFLGIKEALRLSEVIKNEFGSTPKLKFIETTTSGMVTGFFVGSFWWQNPISFITTAATFGVIAGTGQLIYDRVEKWRIQKAISLRYPELVELEWLALDASEQEIIKQNNKTLLERIYDKLTDRPLAGKLKLKQKSLLEELESLIKQESELLEQLGLARTEDVDIPDISSVR